MTADCGPADRSTVIVTSFGVRSTLPRSSPAAPWRQTHTPLTATFSRSGSKTASVVPTAARIRPQLGSSPPMAHLTRLLRATARPTVTASFSLAAPMTSMVIIFCAPSASSWSWRARSAHTSVSVTVNSPTSGRTPVAPLASSSTVSLVDMQPSVSSRSKVPATADRSAASSSAGGQIRVGGQHAQHGGQRRRDHARALGHAPDGPGGGGGLGGRGGLGERLPPRSRGGLGGWLPRDNTEGDLDHGVGGPDRVGGEQAARPGHRGDRGVDARQQLVHGQPLADQPGRADGDLARRSRRWPGQVFGCGVRVLEAGRSGAGVGPAGVEHHGAHPPAADHLAGPRHRRGLDPVAR